MVESSQESPLAITLFQGLAKGDKMDLVIQKAVELGAIEVVPFTSRFTVVRLEEKQARTRQTRWERIALEAAKQSGRTRIPIIGPLHTFSGLSEAVKARCALGDLVILAYEGATKMGIGSLDDPKQGVAVIVGPEGGFAPDEVEALALAGAKVCTLGPRILRTETAGLALLSMIGYKWGDLG
jgi:16S rRNA (uracil1498-N3)-methyltransferase